MIETKTLLQDRYLIERKIGTGGMGAVYLAVDQRFDNHVAIKETFYKDEELCEAFEREARLLNALQHPVLPHVTDYFAENNNYFLVMQFIEGEDLSDILKREGAFSVEDVVRWTDQMLDALDYLHSQEPPIIHRDIKPHNLKLTPRGDIMLLDFGLAKLNYDDQAGAISVFGYSRTYSPLEQIQGTGTDGRSDIFALGATAFHLLTGQPPVDALTRAASIVNGNTDPIQLASDIKPEIPVAVASILNSALALNPQNRFISAAAMRQALEHAVSEISNDSASEPVVVPAQTETHAPVVIDSAANENFPALEVFAADVNHQQVTAVSENADDLRSEPQNFEAPIVSPPVEESSAPIIINAAAPPRVSEHPAFTRRSAVLAALAAFLIFGLAAAWFLAGRDDTAGQTEQTPANDASLDANREVSEKKSSKSVPETRSETKSKSETEQNTGEKRGANGAADEESSTKTSENPAQPARQAESRGKSEEQGNGETRSRVIPDEPSVADASEVETIFTGRDNNTTVNRERRRRNTDGIPEVMTEEEFERLRQERKRRRQDRRRDPIPF